MTSLGKRLVKAAEEARAIARGEADSPRIYVPQDVDVKALRTKLDMTQTQFAYTFGLPLGNVRDWEQGRGQPETVARAYLLAISQEPKMIARAFKQAVVSEVTRQPRRPRTQTAVSPRMTKRLESA
jgi:putative transcriptional regulator